MGLVEDVQPVMAEDGRPPNKPPSIDDIYGYDNVSEEEKNNLLMKFLEYVKASKERDRARLRQSRLIE